MLGKEGGLGGPFRGRASYPPFPFLQDPFLAFHIDKALVRKYMSPLLIGELSPEQPSFEPTKNVSQGLAGEGGQKPRWDHR